MLSTLHAVRYMHMYMYTCTVCLRQKLSWMCMQVHVRVHIHTCVLIFRVNLASWQCVYSNSPVGSYRIVIWIVCCYDCTVTWLGQPRKKCDRTHWPRPLLEFADYLIDIHIPRTTPRGTSWPSTFAGRMGDPAPSPAQKRGSGRRWDEPTVCASKRTHPPS